MKRLRWFIAGSVAGAAGARLAKKRIQAVAEKVTPVNIARKTIDGARRRVSLAMSEGRSAMVTKEAEMRSRIDGHPVNGVPDSSGSVEQLDDYRHRRRRAR